MDQPVQRLAPDERRARQRQGDDEDGERQPDPFMDLKPGLSPFDRVHRCISPTVPRRSHGGGRQVNVRANNQLRNALARLGGSSAAIRSTSISATSADSGRPQPCAASSSARQNTGSRLIDVW
ncbi:hypothetical protein WR25_06458 [Diploscapter pachys]|uniref:Uncharacterized protein n=1 Tax=Diploscapter pachys TaxID=2018661 RepID=A0A2A2JXE6_9BILA|nr:hypothetical protein WR25_06458 [Diploscapter pachys]